MDFEPIGDILNKRYGSTPSLPYHSTELKGCEGECPKCKGSGFVYAVRGDGSVDYNCLIPCSCAEDHTDITKQRLLEASGIPSARTGDTFAKLKAIPKFKPALDASKALASGTASFSMLALVGSMGVGKTHLLYASVIHRCTEMLQKARYNTMRGILSQMQLAMTDPQQNTEKILSYYSECPFLAIDEIGKQHEGNSGWASSVVEMLIDARYANMLPTIIASNFDVDNFPDSLASRLKDASQSRVIHINTEDYRLKQRGE
jgi:DNA replication protein DnaC